MSNTLPVEVLSTLGEFVERKCYVAKKVSIEVLSDSDSSYAGTRGINEHAGIIEWFQTGNARVCKIFCLMQNEAFFTRTQFWSSLVDEGLEHMRQRKRTKDEKLDLVLQKQTIWTKDDLLREVLSSTNGDDNFLLLTAFKVLGQKIPNFSDEDFEPSAVAKKLDELTEEQMDDILRLQESCFRYYEDNEGVLESECYAGESFTTCVYSHRDGIEYGRWDSGALYICKPLDLSKNGHENVASLVKLMEKSSTESATYYKRKVSRKKRGIKETQDDEFSTLDGHTKKQKV